MKRALIISLIMMFNSCTIGLATFGSMNSATHFEGHVEYLLNFDTKDKILHEFQYVMMDSIHVTEIGKIEIIQVSVFPNDRDLAFITWGTSIIDVQPPKAQAYVEFQLENNKLVHFKSQNVRYKKSNGAGVKTFLGGILGALLDVAIISLTL